jgi:DNA-directed RNA polymerase subunit alpha
MENIALPNKIDFKKGDSANSGCVSIEPLYTGYGMTLGNSLRRVLLSSLSGAAVIGVKIKGVAHEFMALPNVQDDVLEIILNLKELRLKVHSDEEIKLELHIKGKKQVTAEDIEKNSDVEIINSDLKIAEITEAKGSLDMEIIVSAGRGYKLAETNKKEAKDLGYLEIDSVFSPVTAVSLKVENVRVGKMTNWDKLILDITTDGTMTFEEAFNDSVAILVNQFSSLVPKEKEAKKSSSKTSVKKSEEDKKDKK